MKTDRKELVEWVRGIYQNLDDADKRDALRFFPELEESEDERIRRFIQDRLTDRLWNPTWKFSRDDVLAYLERKKEQKPFDIIDAADMLTKAGYKIISKGDAQNPTDLPSGLNVITEDGKKIYSKELRFGDCRIKLGPKACEDKDAIVANLEKQDYSGMSELENAIHRGFLCAGVENVSRTIIEETAQECMSKMRPAEWRRFLWHPMMRFDYTSIVKYDGSEDYEIVKAGNKPSKEQNGVFIPIKEISTKPQWKPSEKQMDGLKHFVDWHRQQYLTASTPWPAYEALQSLQTDLLKLK